MREVELDCQPMSEPYQSPRSKPIDPSAPRAPDGWVWIAGVAILALASYGLYRGITEVRTGNTSLLPVAGPGIVAPVDASAAAALPHDDQWSTLSGPKVLPPAPPKPVKAAVIDDSADDSDAPPAKAAVDNGDDSQDDTPPPPVKAAKKVARPPDDAAPARAPAPSPDDQ